MYAYVSTFVSIFKVHEGVDVPMYTEPRSAQRYHIPCSWSYKCLLDAQFLMWMGGSKFLSS